MNYAIVLKLQSAILATLAGAFALCIGIAWKFDHESTSHIALNGFIISCSASAALSLGCFLIGKKADSNLYNKEALAVIGVGWLLASGMGALPYLLIIPEISFAGAFFESASGLTTTGASVLSDLERLPYSLHFWRCISQWIGGLGVVVFFVALLGSLGTGAKILFSRESSAQVADLEATRIQQGVLKLVQIYLLLSGSCFLVYWGCGLSPFDALMHMFTTLSTGGFSTRSASLLAYHNPTLEWAAIVFMALGGTSFLLLSDCLKGKFSKLRKSTEFKAYSLIILVSSTLIVGFLYLGDTGAESILTNIRLATFQVVSIMTTTGFATADFNQWLPVTHVLLLTLMFVGGCSGSTAGGAKVIRWVVWTKSSLHNIEKAYRTQVVRPMRINAKSLQLSEIESISAYLILLVLVFMLGVLLMAFFEPSLSFPGIVSGVAACLFNIGPGFAELGPTHNFAGLHEHTKVFLSVFMIMGRLELFAILVLFFPALWKRY
jgi:trk system potassium uptake protein TrkH